jgi:hypothetical protein
MAGPEHELQAGGGSWGRGECALGHSQSRPRRIWLGLGSVPQRELVHCRWL